MPARTLTHETGERAAVLCPPGSGNASDAHDRRGFADPRVRLLYAVLYAVGLLLTAVGSVGALIWAPLLWCAAAGFVVITVSFAVRAGRF